MSPRSTYLSQMVEPTTHHCPNCSAPVEVPLGEGSVAFKYYLKALDDIGYDGFLTIEREVGEDPITDVAKAIQFLRSFE